MPPGSCFVKLAKSESLSLKVEVQTNLWAMSNQTIKILCPAEDVDLISALPDHMIETILIKLPLRDAARTCILSTRWRSCWVKLPCLKLDAAFWEQSFQNESKDKATKFAIVLFRILLLHQGPITSISLDIPELGSPPEIHPLINFIVSGCVQKCVLGKSVGGHFKLDASLFTCPTLNYLDLRSCDIIFLPTTFETCSNLTTIILHDVTISAQALKSLLSSCPFLYSLQLVVPVDIQCLEIKAPKLVQFYYYYFNGSQSSPAVNYGQGQQAILKIFGGFPDLKYLHLDSHCIKCLAAGGVPTRLPTGMLHSVKIIDLLRIRFKDVDQFLSVLCLIRSSPRLRKFQVYYTKHIVNNNNDMENLQEVQDYSDLTLSHLVEVNMSSVVGGRLELELIKILLAKSPKLRNMNIGLATSVADKGLKIIKQMLNFQRASPNVEVLIDD